MSILSRFFEDRSGNFAVMTALVMPLLLSGGVLALEFATAYVKHSEAQDATDRVALAAAKRMLDGESAKSVQATAKAQFADLMGISTDMVDVAVKPGSAGKNTVEIVGSYTTTSTGFFTSGQTQIKASSTAQGSGTSAIPSKSVAALSMYFVLDRSGSMIDMTDQLNTKKIGCYSIKYPTHIYYVPICYMTKMEVMKRSITDMFRRLEADKTRTLYARTGVISYHYFADIEQPITDQPENTLTYIDKLIASGATNSAPAFKIAEKAFVNEDAEHIKANGRVAPKYLVFITDGANADIKNHNRQTVESCEKIKAQGVMIYSIFLKYRYYTDAVVKEADKMVRTCASTPQTYFRANDGVEFTAAINVIASIASSSSSKLIR